MHEVGAGSAAAVGDFSVPPESILGHRIMASISVLWTFQSPSFMDTSPFPGVGEEVSKYLVQALSNHLFFSSCLQASKT